jgi:hypothetical protein
MLEHTVPICITPLVGQTAALVKGLRAFRADWIAGGPAAAAPAKGTAAIQRAATAVASPNVVAALAEIFAFEVNIGVSPVMR